MYRVEQNGMFPGEEPGNMGIVSREKVRETAVLSQPIASVIAPVTFLVGLTYYVLFISPGM